jgi:hypothetical protein
MKLTNEENIVKFKKNYLASALVAATLVGCGSDSDDEAGQGFVSCEADVCTLNGLIDEDFTLSADKEWILSGLVQVGAGNVEVTSAAEVQALKDSGVDLTIEEGVHVKALNDGVLLVTRGSRLIADGSETQPIVMSSYQDTDFDGEGEWGGVIVQGFAPQYGAGNTGPCFGEGNDAVEYCNVQGEGGDFVGVYGGVDADDDSGIFNYFVIAEAGKVAGPNNEVNGLTLQGVGHSTVVEYVQVHGNLDDGIEWFGGTVNARYLVLTGNDDDDIDFDTGYKGNIQFAIIRKNPTKTGPSGSNDPRGIEANSSDDEYVPQTEGALANVTIVGSEVNFAENSKGDGNQPGMRLRGSLTARIYNSAVLNFDDCVRVDDSDHDLDGKYDHDSDPSTEDITNPNATAKIASDVTLHNVIGECPDKFYAKRDADTETGTVGAGSVDLDEAAALPAGDATVTQADFVEVDNGSGFAFENTTYIGAVAPGTTAANAWWAGWTVAGSMDDIETQGETVAP